MILFTMDVDAKNELITETKDAAGSSGSLSVEEAIRIIEKVYDDRNRLEKGERETVNDLRKRITLESLENPKVTDLQSLPVDQGYRPILKGQYNE